MNLGAPGTGDGLVQGPVRPDQGRAAPGGQDRSAACGLAYGQTTALLPVR